MADPFGIAAALAAWWGISSDSAGFIFGAVLTVVLLVALEWAIGKNHSGPALLFVSVGLGIGFGALFGWFPAWFVIFIAIMVLAGWLFGRGSGASAGA